jgi:hypothetical protein
MEDEKTERGGDQAQQRFGCVSAAPAEDLDQKEEHEG